MQPKRRVSLEGSVQGTPSKAEKKRKPQWMKAADKFMDSGEMQLFLAVLLLLSLFLADAWIVGNAPDYQNEGMYSVLMFVVVVFTAEVTILSVVSDGYFNSFFFWMDFLGTISILLDIGWISNAFLSGASVRRGSVLRATRAAKLGARYGRILRLMKLMKMTKWCPCLKSNVAEDVKAEPTLSAVVKISSELTATISRQVALLVVLIVIVVPFLAYTNTDYSQEAFLTVLKSSAKNGNCTAAEINRVIHKFNRFYHYKDFKLYDVEVQSPFVDCGGTYWGNGTLAEGSYTQGTFYQEFHPTLRDVTKSSNLLPYWRDFDFDGDTYKVRCTIDATVPNQWSAFYGIILMILVIGVLFGFSASFHMSIEKLVVVPLQKLMSTLRKSATIMIDSLKSLEKEKKEEDKAKAAESGKESLPPQEDDSEDDDEDVEAAMLEQLVEKLSKIVKHVLPSSNDIVDSENIDTATASWLNQQYTSGGGQPTSKAPVGPAAVKLIITPDNTEARNAAAEVAEEKAQRLKMLTISVAKIATPEELNSWEFDVLNTRNNEQCIEVVEYIFEVTFGFYEEFNIDHIVLNNFLNALAKRYINTNTYHNYKHATDVCHTAYRLMMVAELNTVATGGSGAFSSIEMLSLLIAALGHDVGHPAVNNGFLVKTKHALAFQHNDKSPLENMHCVVMYEIMSQTITHTTLSSSRGLSQRMKSAGSFKPGGEETGSATSSCDVFASLTEAQWRESRKVILACILGTDMVHHFEQVKKTQLFNDLHNESILNYYRGEADVMECLKDNNNRLFVLELVLHCSDISNPFKPFDICAKWADLVMAEFFSQGDQERELGLDISPGFDRNTTNLFNMQMGFIEFVVQPLIGATVTIFPPLVEIGDNMLANFLAWGKKRMDEIPEDPKIAADDRAVEVGKLQGRLNKFKEKMGLLSECKAIIKEAKANKARVLKEKAQAGIGSMEIS